MDLNSVKNIIRSILVSSPDAISVLFLQRDYENFEGAPLPYRAFGFGSAHAFLDTLTDTVVLRGHGNNARCSAVATQNNQHIARLVSVQRKPDKLPRRRAQRMCNDRFRYDHNNYGRSERNGFYRSSIADRYSENRYQYQSPPRSNCVPSNTISQPEPKNSQPSQIPAPVMKQPQNAVTQEPTVEQFVPPTPEKEPSPFDVALTKLSNEKTSALDVLKSKFATAETKECQQPQQQKMPPSYGPPELTPEKREVKVPKPKPKFSQVFADVIAEVAEEEYWDEAPVPDQQKTFTGYTHKVANAGSLVPGPDTSSYSDDSISMQLMPFETELRPSKSPAAETVTNCDYFDSIGAALPNVDAYDPISMIGVAEGVASAYHNIPEANISDYTKDLNLNEFVLIFVAEFYSPHRFWFHFHTNCEEFDDLMDRLNEFYRNIGDHELNMGYCNIQVGQVCAARFDDHWSRAEIINGVDANDRVEINYVDYNTVRTVPLNHLKFLMQEFAMLPKQAFRGCLNGILPKTFTYKDKVLRRWHLGATGKMIQHMSGMLHCKIIHVDYEAKITYMQCIDTVSSIHEDYMVNDVMCHHNYAYYDYGLDRVRDHGEYVQIRSHYEKNYSKIEPTFEQLELGQKPAYAELMEFGFEDDPKTPDMGEAEATMDQQIKRKLNTTNPFLPGFQSTNTSRYLNSTNPFIDVNQNFNSTNPMNDVSCNLDSTNPFFKNYDLDKSVILPDNNRSSLNDFSTTVAHQSRKVINSPNIPYGRDCSSDSDSNNESVMYMGPPSTTDLRELTFKVDNMVQALENLKMMEKAYQERK